LSFTWYTPSINFSDLFFGLGSLIAIAFGWVQNAIEYAVQRLGEVIMGIVSSAFDAFEHIDNALKDAAGVAAIAIDGLQHGFFEIAKTVTTLVPETFRAALDGVETIIWKLLQTWLPDVLREVGSILEPAVRAVLGPLWDALEWLGDAWPVLRDGWDFLYQLLTNPLDAIWQLIVAPILAGAGTIVKAGLDLLWPGLVDLFDLLTTTFGWLLDFALDPAGTLDSFTEGIAQRLLPFLRDEIAQAVDNAGPSFDRYITNALGLN